MSVGVMLNVSLMATEHRACTPRRQSVFLHGRDASEPPGALLKNMPGDSESVKLHREPAHSFRSSKGDYTVYSLLRTIAMREICFLEGLPQHILVSVCFSGPLSKCNCCTVELVPTRCRVSALSFKRASTAGRDCTPGSRLSPG